MTANQGKFVLKLVLKGYPKKFKIGCVFIVFVMHSGKKIGQNNLELVARNPITKNKYTADPAASKTKTVKIQGVKKLQNEGTLTVLKSQSLKWLTPLKPNCYNPIIQQFQTKNRQLFVDLAPLSLTVLELVLDDALYFGCLVYQNIIKRLKTLACQTNHL